MAQKFAVERVTEAVWPEILGLVGLAGLHLLARTVDGWMAWNRPFRRVSDWTHVAVLGGSAFCVGTNRAPDLSKAIFYGDSMLVVSALGDWAYEKTVGTSIAKVRMRKLAERQIRQGGGGGSLTEAQKQQLLLEAQGRMGARQRVGAGSTLEF